MIRKYWGRSSRGFARVLSGTTVAQVISFAVIPVLTRLYSPEDYGVYATVVALASIAGPVATLRLETAAMLPDKLSETRALVWLALCATGVVAVVYGIGLQAFSAAGVGGLDAHPSLPLWIPLLIVLSACFTIFSQLSLRKHLYSIVARRTLLRSATAAAAQLCFGFARFGPSGLILGTAIGSSVGIASMVARAREFLPYPGIPEMRRALKKFWRFPLVFTPSALLNTLGIQAPIVFATAVFGLEAAGQLGIAERIVALPLTLIGSAVGQVIGAEVSDRLRNQTGGLVRYYMVLSLLMSVLAVVVAVTFGFLGPWLVALFLGPTWELAGMMIQILAITSAFRLIASPLSKFLILLQAALANTALDIFRVVAMAAAMTTVIAVELPLLNALWVVYSALSLTYVATWVYGLVLVRRYEEANP